MPVEVEKQKAKGKRQKAKIPNPKFQTGMKTCWHWDKSDS